MNQAINFVRIAAFATSLLLTLTTIAQYKQQVADFDVTNVSKATFLNPGLSYEGRIGRNQTLFGHAYMSVSASYSYSTSFGSNAYFWMDPALTAQYRYYYNGSKRHSQGKRTAFNSVNYIAPIYKILFSKGAITDRAFTEENRRVVTTIGFA